jgi:hypothetical protein
MTSPAPAITTKLGIHGFRATGITTYLKNGGTLEKAAQMANPMPDFSALLSSGPNRSREAVPSAGACGN